MKNKNKHSKNSFDLNESLHKIIIFLCVIVLSPALLLVFNAVFPKEKTVVEKIEVEKIVIPDNLLFVGDSITYNFDLEGCFKDMPVVNSGRNANQTTDILDNLKSRIYDYNPSKIFLLIGTNDIDQRKSTDEIFGKTKEIIKKIKENRSEAKIYIQSVYPVNESDKYDGPKNRTNEKIEELNQRLEEYCKKEKIIFIDLYSELVDEDGQLKEEYTTDGLHISEEGYEIITEVLKEYL